MCKKMAMVTSENIVVTVQEGNYVSFATDSADSIISSKMSFGELNPKDPIYEGVFFSSSLSQLIKISGFDTKLLLQVCAPKNNKLPLKLVSQTKLGTFEVLLKTKAQIEHEEKLRE